jgi:hypothetical protein
MDERIRCWDTIISQNGQSIECQGHESEDVGPQDLKIPEKHVQPGFHFENNGKSLEVLMQ